MKNETIGARLRRLRKEAGLTQQELARQAGVAQSTVGNIESGLRGYGSSVVEFARVLNTTPDSLIGSELPEKNIEAAAKAVAGEVPVISWVQAGAWQEVCHTFQPSEAERVLPIFRGHSSHTYALRVRGDSMTAQHGRSYPEGCYIIVDPAKVCPVNGDRVVALVDGANEATFKVFKQEDGRTWLAPLNIQHPVINDQFKVLGTVIGKWEDE